MDKKKKWINEHSFVIQSCIKSELSSSQMEFIRIRTALMKIEDMTRQKSSDIITDEEFELQCKALQAAVNTCDIDVIETAIEDIENITYHYILSRPLPAMIISIRKIDKCENQ